MPSVIMDEPPKLIQPRNHKAKVSIWVDLTVSDMDRIDEAGTADQVKQELSQIFNLNDHNENIKNEIVVDLYYYTINFARDNRFTKEQTSAFFSIVKKTHEVCIETPFGNVEQCFAYFRDLVLCHAVKRPPFSIDLFSAEEVRKITDYVVNTYFRHYKMYKYVFTPLVRLDLTMNYVGMPPTPVPSEVGDTEAMEGEANLEDDNAEGAAPPGAEEDTTQEVQTIDEETGTPETPKRPKDGESPAAKELRALIKDQLSDELKKLKMSVEEQIKESEVNLSKKLASIEGTTSAKGGRGSAKKRK